MSKGVGPITIDASCDLTVTGEVSSQGEDPGADLVHLEGGCAVRILGLVESTGFGHGIPNNPPTLCATRPGKPANTTACVEVVAGNLLIIDSTAPNKGELKADTGGSGGSAGSSFINVFARGDIITLGGTAGPFAVHANGSATNDEGGDGTVQSVAGNVTASGRALQADAIRPVGDGGLLVVEAAINLTLDTASLFAVGDFKPAGGLGLGGTLAARAFNTPLSVQNGDVDVRPSGTITLTACRATTMGTDLHGVTPTVNTGVCGGTPTLPSYVVLPDCLCHLGIEVTKECGCSQVGLNTFEISFSGTICNTGLTTLSGVTVVDDKAGLVSLADTTLVPTECVNYNDSFITMDNPSTDRVTTIGSTGAQTISDTASATCGCFS